MAEEKKSGNGFSLFKILNIFVAFYFVLLGLGVSLPYLDMIPLKYAFFLVAALLVFATFSGPTEYGLRKRIADDLKHK